MARRRSGIRQPMRKLLPLLGLSLLGCDPAPTPPPAPTAPPTANTAASPEAPATAPTAVPTAAPTAMVPDRPESAPGLEQLAEGQNAFGFELFQNLDQEGNLVSSPASVGMALAMTYMGARGATAAEMSKTLRLTQEQSALEKGFATLLHDWQRPEPAPADVENAEPLTVRIANRIFGESTLKVDDRFRDLTRRGFGAPLGAWLKRDLQPMMHRLLSRQAVEARGFFSWPVVEETMALHLSSREDHTDHLLSLLNLEIWAQIFLDGRSPADIAEELSEEVAAVG